MFGLGIRKKALEKRHKYGVPDDAKIITYFGGYDKNLESYPLYWLSGDCLRLCELSPKGIESEPFIIAIPKENIIAFTMTGDITMQTSVNGGGASIGGALIGAAVAGPVGAIIGGQKKVKTQTTTLDTRRTFLKFREDGVEKTMQFSDGLYNDLCMFCMEKKI